MCFSPEADFVSGIVIGGIGVAALREVRHAREVPLAALPMAFAVHQITEGFVWLGLQGHVPRSVGDVAMYAYLLYAWALLPCFAPFAIYLVEPQRRRQQLMLGLVAINLLNTSVWWVQWPLLGWGFGVLAHGLAVRAKTARAGLQAKPAIRTTPPVTQ